MLLSVLPWKSCLARRLVVMIMLGALTSPSWAQEDTTATPLPIMQDDHSPRGALVRAAILPGWGQIYNRQYYKLPFVYAGLGGFIYGVIYTNERVQYYRNIYLYALNPEEYPEYADEAARFQHIIDSGQADLLKQQRENFKRNRDLFVFGVGLFYGLTMLDAFVSAHLRDFDVGEDLTLQVIPRGVLAPQGYPTLTVRLQF